MILDVRGLECPEPKIRMIQALSTKGAEGLTILVDSAAARENLRSMLDIHGYRYTLEDRRDHWAIALLDQ